MTDFYRATLCAIAFIFILLIGATVATYERPVQMAGIWPDCATGQGNLNNATLVLPADSLNLDLFAGSLVGAFTPDGDCIGMTFFHGNANQNLVIRGADPDSPDTRGAEVGESFELRVLNEIAPSVSTNVPLVYAHDALFIVRSGDYPDSTDDTARVEELEAEVEALTGEVDALTTERDALLTDVDNLTSERDNLETSVNNLQTQVNQYQEALGDAQTTITAYADRIDTVVAILTSEL